MELISKKSTSQFVAGGGWVTRKVTGRPRALLFGLLSIYWLPVSVGALLVMNLRGAALFGPAEWLCAALLVPQPVLLVLAIWFLLTERPRIFERRRQNPKVDPRNLY